MRMLLVPAAVAFLSACISEAPETQFAGAAAAGKTRCISASQISGRRITGPRTLEFEVGAVTYRNDLPGVCPGLASGAKFDTLQLEVNGGEICAGDSFRAVDPVEARAVGTSSFPRCRLGAFTRLESAGRR